MEKDKNSGIDLGVTNKNQKKINCDLKNITISYNYIHVCICI